MQPTRHANFQVDPRLATLLGETYRSTEQALKELADNAWDADSPNVWITLPDPMTLDPIIVRDDGSGMTERELRQEYLKVARDRRANKGERTPRMHRLVKGRKGIGKFAGLIIAEIMTVETSARGQTTCLTILVNDQPLGVADIGGESFTNQNELPDVGNVRLHKIPDDKQPAKNAGVAIRVNGTIVGPPPDGAFWRTAKVRGARGLGPVLRSGTAREDLPA